MTYGKIILPGILMALITLGGVGCAPQTDAAAAQDALTRYFSLLHEGNYAEAAKLYGGDYNTLVEWNPDVDPNDHAGLFERGCTINGLQCLPIKTVGAREDAAPGIFEFYVQFEDPSGGVFVLESAPGESTFKFTVVKTEGGFFVQELPVYVP